MHARDNMPCHAAIRNTFLCSHPPNLAAKSHNKEASQRWTSHSEGPQKTWARTVLHCDKRSRRSAVLRPSTPHPQCAASCTSNGAANTSKTSGNTAATPPRPRAPPASPNAVNNPAKPSSPNTPSRPLAPPQTSTATSAANSRVVWTTRRRRSSK